MRSCRLGWIGLLTACAWLSASLPLHAQSPQPPPEEEWLPPATAWQEPSIESQLQLPPEEAFVEPPPAPGRPSPGAGANGMGGMGGMGGGPMGGPGGRSPFSAYAFFQPESNLRNQPGTLEVTGEGFSLGVPVSIGPNGIWILNTSVGHNSFGTDVLLPGSMQSFPDDLWNINLGLMHIHPFENGWTAGGMVSVGSASDKPFDSIDEMNAMVLGFLNVPVRERDAWNFSLFYSPLGQIAFPIPGVAYAWRPTEQFQMNIGLPFSLHYRPTDTISFDLSYVPLTNANAMVRWTPNELWSIYGGYQTHSQGYQLADRVDIRERFFDFDQRLNLGVQRQLGAGFALDCSTAYLFNRSYFLSESFSSEGAERLRVDPGAQFMLRLEWAR